MNKLSILLIFLLPSLDTAAALLAAKDENSTGVDDEAAEAIKFCAERLRKYQASK